MSFLIDTNVAIHLRDDDDYVSEHFAGLSSRPALSLISVIELRGGIPSDPEQSIRRRARLTALLEELEILDLERSMVDVYGRIVEQIGFSRRRILDRLIAATAIVHDLTLITINSPDFRDIPDLKLEVWPSTAQ